MKIYIIGFVLMLSQCGLLYLAYLYGRKEEIGRMGRMLDYYAREYVKNREGIDAVGILKKLLKGKGFR